MDKNERITRAYFESEAARPAVSAGDSAYAVAVSALADDRPEKWEAWIAGAGPVVGAAVRAAYIDRNAAVEAQNRLRGREVTRAYDDMTSAGVKPCQAAKK